MAQKRRKGRPPRYVLDENGKEVVGLSHNKSTGMYYATFSEPRVYFSAGGKSQNRKQNAIIKYITWAKTQKLSPEQQQEKTEYDRAYEKARELLLENDFLQEEITKKAKQLLEEAENDSSRDEYRRFNMLVDRKAELLIKNGERDEYIVSNLERYFLNNGLYKKISELIKESLRRGRLPEFREYLWEMIHDELLRNPIEIAKATKIPQLAFIRKQVHENSLSQSMSWKMAWQIFREHKPKNECRFDESWYLIIEEKLSYRFNELPLEKVGHDKLYDALTFKIRGNEFGEEGAIKFMEQFNSIPMEDKLELLEEVFLTIKEAGYPHANNALHGLKTLYRILCKTE